MPLRLAIFDLDGTLKVARDPYVYLHERLGTLEASHAFLAKGLSGEIPYEEWLRLDVGLWKGVPRAVLEGHLRANPYLPGAREVVETLRRAGVRIALISTGLNVHADLVRNDLQIDHVVANELYFEDGCCTGLARAHVAIGMKGQIVEQLQLELGIRPDECLAAGDTVSDVDMFGRVRLGVAVNASSDRVREAAGLVLEAPDLRPFLPRLNEVWPNWSPESTSS